MKLWRFVGAGALTLLLAACGGGGGAPGCSVFESTDCNGPTVTSGNTATPTAVQVQFEPGAITNSGLATAVSSIRVVGEGGRALSGVPVKLLLNDAEVASSWASTATVDTASGNPLTNASGLITATVTVLKGSALRSLTLAATAGSVSGSSRLNVGASTTLASDLLLTLSAPQIPNSVAAAVTVTATAVDGSRRTLAGIPVTLSVDEDSGGTIAPSGTVTGSAGTVTGAVKIGSNRTNRIIKVTATSGEVTRTVDLEVTGATLNASPAKSLLNFGEDSFITYKLVDSTGAAMPLQNITVTASSVGTTTGRTDSQGEFRYVFTAPPSTTLPLPGAISVLATAAGTKANSAIELSSAIVKPAEGPVVSASVSANPSVVAINQPGSQTVNKVEIRALFLGDKNKPIQNVRAWFDLGGDISSVGGSLESTAGGKFLYSDTNGIVRTNFVPGSRFSPKDGVTVRVCYATDDFTPPADGGACPNAATTRLTVISESLSVSIGSDNRLADGSGGLTYVQRFAVQVVDSAGRAKSGVAIAPSVDLIRYYKGRWRNNLGVVWVKAGLGTTFPPQFPSGALVPGSLQRTDLTGPTECDNEDMNRNGAVENYIDQVEGLEVSEDANNSASEVTGRPALDPRKADVTVTSVGGDTTNSDGVVVLRIEYPKNLASWVRYRLLVSASGVAGTEGRAVFESDLLTLAADISNLQVSPPFEISPYGQLASPAYPRQFPGVEVQYVCTNPN